jgi:[CysO sulfur-carrier protein]-S-L-cysteine hydrolase
VVIPAAIREELVAHALAERPNECCGLIVFAGETAERYVPGRNKLASPYRYELEIDPEIWFLEDDGYELAVFHSHPDTQPIPSKTDQELSGLWGGRTFLIYGVKFDDLRAWKITRESVEALPLD